MAISRMQQPRQMYGLGSFVKKLTRKVTKPFTKVAKKIVPKEIAGIMRVAAPFLPPQFRAAAYLLGTAKQTGRISPIDLALVAAPRLSQIDLPESRFIPESMQGLNLREIIGNLEVPLSENKTIREVLVGNYSVTPDELVDLGEFGKRMSYKKVPGSETSGIFGKGGEMFKFGQDKVGLLDTKAGQTLFGKPEMKKGKATGEFVLSPLKIGSTGVSLASFIKDSKTPEEAGTKLVEATGDPDAYNEGYQLFSQLTPELFEIPERFRLPVAAAKGGLMRTNYALGSDDDDKPVLPEDPTKPVNPFGPKPIKPLGDMKMASSDRYQRILEQLINELESQLGRELTDAEYDMVGKMAYDKLSDPDFAVGGRVDYALGTKPTAEESGLGGLPIEADMRYTGGFMPYGAKEKADDVPARLSKNEFVFTADAVRAAGGGSVNEGAKKMYQTMKQLEAKPEAKGMMA